MKIFKSLFRQTSIKDNIKAKKRKNKYEIIKAKANALIELFNKSSH
jgi:hypothetical protein